jgi:hypothetical protein
MISWKMNFLIRIFGVLSKFDFPLPTKTDYTSQELTDKPRLLRHRLDAENRMSVPD